MKKRTDLGCEQGFTLLEILCVIALTAIASMLVMLALPADQQQHEYQKIKRQIEQTAQQAQLTGDVYGLRLLPNGWEIVVLRPSLPATSQQQAQESALTGNLWRTASYGRRLLRYTLPADLLLTLLTGDQRFDSGMQANPGAAPQVLFLPGGEVTAFSFYLREIADNKQQAAQILIHVNDRGMIAEAGTQQAQRAG